MAVETPLVPSTKRGRVSGAEAVVRALEAASVEYVFGLCGHTNLALLEALGRSSVNFIGVRHEQIAAHAADGYYRATHRPAAVLTTIGPGLTNALTGVGDAAADGAAMLVMSGDVPTYYTGMDAFQELSMHGDAQQVELYRPIVKRAWRVPHRAVLVHDVIRAISYATTGRPGPVLLDIPMDLLSEPYDDEIPNPRDRMPTDGRVAAHPEHVAAAARLLLEAERPVVYAGGGAVASEAQPIITQLAEYLGIPVVTTLSGQGAISQDHPLSAGYTATVGVPVAHELVHEADVILALGTQFAEMETSSWNRNVSFNVPPTRVIQVDIDPVSIGKNVSVHIGIQADIDTFLRQLLTIVRDHEAPRAWEEDKRYRRWRNAADEWLQSIAEAATSLDRPITVERLLSDIRSALPRDGIFLTDVGIRHQVAQQFPIYEQMTHYVGSGWGTMGGAVGAALGAKLGCPDRAVVAEVGDGAFGSTLSAVITAAEYSIPVTWVVMNNFGYSSISVYQAKHGLGDLGTRFTSGGEPYNPDFAAFAHACGAYGVVVEDPADLRHALERAIESNQPWVLDVHTEAAPRSRATGYWDVNDILGGVRFSDGEADDGGLGRE